MNTGIDNTHANGMAADLDTDLGVKGKVENVDVAGGGEHSPGLPVHLPIRLDQHANLLELVNHLIRPASRHTAVRSVLKRVM